MAKNAKSKQKGGGGSARPGPAVVVVKTNTTAPAKRSTPAKKKKAGKKGGKKLKRAGNPTLVKRGLPLLSDVPKMLRLGAFAAGGALASKELTQMAFKAHNVGLKGYAAHLGVGAVMLAIGRMLRASPADLAAMGAGIGAALVTRVVAERSNPVLAELSLSGLGDVSSVMGSREMVRRIQIAQAQKGRVRGLDGSVQPAVAAPMNNRPVRYVAPSRLAASVQTAATVRTANAA